MIGSVNTSRQRLAIKSVYSLLGDPSVEMNKLEKT